MPEPLVSVLILNYNYGAFVGAAIESVTRQSYTNLQIVVRDDGSTDESWATIERLAAADPRIEPHRNERNLGMDATVRRLFADARGDYIGILASDDRYAEEHVEEALRLYRRYPQYDFIYRNYFVMDRDGRPFHLADPGGAELSRVPFVEHFADRNEFLALWTFGSYVNFSTALIPRALVDELGPYGADGITMGDYELSMRWAAAGKRMAYWATPVAFNRRHETQFSAGIDQARFRKEVLLLGERYLTAANAREIRRQPARVKSYFQWAAAPERAEPDDRARIEALLARIDTIAALPEAEVPARPGPRWPAVSIVLPTRGNDLALLGDALASIRAQTFEDYELVVVGEGSLRLEPIVAYHGLTERTRYVRHRVASSPALARSHGVEASLGEIIAYCDDDNLLLPNHLADLVAAIRDGCDVAVGGAILQLEQIDGERRTRTVLGSAELLPGSSRVISVLADAVPLNAVAHRSGMMGALGAFLPSYGPLADWEFLLRCSTATIGVVPRPVVQVRSRVGFTGQTLAVDLGEYLRFLDDVYAQYPIGGGGPHARAAHRGRVAAAIARRDGGAQRDFELMLTLTGAVL